MAYTGRWKHDIEKNITVSLPVQSNDANSPVKKESKLFDINKKVTDRVDIIKPQSILETHKSSPYTIHSYQVSILKSINLLNIIAFS